MLFKKCISEPEETFKEKTDHKTNSKASVALGVNTKPLTHYTVEEMNLKLPHWAGIPLGDQGHRSVGTSLEEVILNLDSQVAHR